MHRLRNLVEGQSVVVVGNSTALLSEKRGAEIDAHDVVVRINLGVPSHLRQHTAIGTRTDVWAAARFWPDALPKDTQLICWMKLTKLGKEELGNLYGSYPHCPVIEWPKDLEQACAEFVKAPPTTGMRILWWLKMHADPAVISAIGFDFYATACNWSGYKNTHNHSPAKERDAMRVLGITV